MTELNTIPRRQFGPLDSVAGRVWAIAATLVLMVIWLRTIGRPYVCPCGEIELWQGSLSPTENSQQFSDWYSALHVMFGMGLYAFLANMRPAWPAGVKFVVTIASSAIWEGMENTPILIAMFSRPTNGHPYGGDSILNSLGDTLFVAIGFVLSSRLPVWASIATAIGLEIAISLAINDGFLIGTLRLVGIEL